MAVQLSVFVYVFIFCQGSGDDGQNGLWTSKHQRDVFAQLEAATQVQCIL